jgi:hypothetical protein
VSRGRRRQGRHGQRRGQTQAPPTPMRPQPVTPASVEPQQPRSTPPSAENPQAPRLLRKDQERALTAYSWAEEAKTTGKLPEYEIAVQSFAAVLLRSGFAVAVSVLERERDRAGFALLLEKLAARSLPGIAPTASSNWPASVRALPEVPLYMQATRELIAFLGWLRRACRALGAEGKS